MSLPALAKIALATMLGLALLMLLVMLSIWRGVRRRGSLGRTASLIVRIASPVVMGLGGWFLALLVALVAFPGFPLDGQLRAVGSVSVPIGVATYGAWVHLSSAPSRKAAGLAGAVLTALAGAWLAFLAVNGLLAIGTAIIGAALGANLALVVLDLLVARPANGDETRVPTRGRPTVVPGPPAGSPAAPSS
jgi:hypothetical protein